MPKGTAHRAREKQGEGSPQRERKRREGRRGEEKRKERREKEEEDGKKGERRKTIVDGRTEGKGGRSISIYSRRGNGDPGTARGKVNYKKKSNKLN
jgi:hypothetical protein